jgi:RNA polymerase sigma factor (sigma-70 family)
LIVEDLIQEVQVALVPALPRFQGGGALAFRAYLSGIVRHKVFDFLRKDGRLKDAFPPLVSIPPSTASGVDIFASLQDTITSPASRVARAELFELVVELVGFLPERQREAVIMAFIDGLESKEIGKALEIERPAAAMLVLRAVQNLKKLWRKQREPTS